MCRKCETQHLPLKKIAMARDYAKDLLEENLDPRLIEIIEILDSVIAEKE